MSDGPLPYDPWNDAELWFRCSAEGKSASANNLSLGECPYAANTVERAAWINGFEAH